MDRDRATRPAADEMIEARHYVEEVRDPVTTAEAWERHDREQARLSSEGERLEEIVRALEDRLEPILRAEHPYPTDGETADAATDEFTTPLGERLAREAHAYAYRITYLRSTVDRLGRLVDRIEVS